MSQLLQSLWCSKPSPVPGVSCDHQRLHGTSQRHFSVSFKCQFEFLYVRVPVGAVVMCHVCTALMYQVKPAWFVYQRQRETQTQETT